jgi:hypothetical protein
MNLGFMKIRKLFASELTWLAPKLGGIGPNVGASPKNPSRYITPPTHRTSMESLKGGRLTIGTN